MHLHRQSLELQKLILVEEHLDTFWFTNGLAICYSYLGQYKETICLYKYTLELQKRILDDKSPNTLWYINNLSISYSHLGQY